MEKINIYFRIEYILFILWMIGNYNFYPTNLMTNMIFSIWIKINLDKRNYDMYKWIIELYEIYVKIYLSITLFVIIVPILNAEIYMEVLNRANEFKYNLVVQCLVNIYNLIKMDEIRST